MTDDKIAREHSTTTNSDATTDTMFETTTETTTETNSDDNDRLCADTVDPETLQSLRERSGLSQSELADRAGLSRSSIWAAEDGREWVTDDVRESILAALRALVSTTTVAGRVGGRPVATDGGKTWPQNLDDDELVEEYETARRRLRDMNSSHDSRSDPPETDGVVRPPVSAVDNDQNEDENGGSEVDRGDGVETDGGRSLVDATWEDETLLRLTNSEDTHVFIMPQYRHRGERIFAAELSSAVSFVRRRSRRWVEEGVVEDYLQQSDDATTVPISEAPDAIGDWLEKYRGVGHPFDDFYVFIKHRDDGRYKDKLAVETGESPSDARSGSHPEDVEARSPAHYHAGTVREVFETGGEQLPFGLDLKQSQTVGHQRMDLTALLEDGLVPTLTTALDADGVASDAIVGDDGGDDPEIRTDGGLDASGGGGLEIDETGPRGSRDRHSRPDREFQRLSESEDTDRSQICDQYRNVDRGWQTRVARVPRQELSAIADWLNASFASNLVIATDGHTLVVSESVTWSEGVGRVEPRDDWYSPGHCYVREEIVLDPRSRWAATKVSADGLREAIEKTDRETGWIWVAIDRSTRERPLSLGSSVSTGREPSDCIHCDPVVLAPVLPQNTSEKDDRWRPTVGDDRFTFPPRPIERGGDRAAWGHEGLKTAFRALPRLEDRLSDEDDIDRGGGR